MKPIGGNFFYGSSHAFDIQRLYYIHSPSHFSPLLIFLLVDADYRGPVGVVLFNFGEEDFYVKQGDRIAQLILEQVCMVDAEQVEELDETVRGAGGFGSTGVSENPEKKQRTISPTEQMEDGKVEPPTAESK
jgi:hypothetical protein